MIILRGVNLFPTQIEEQLMAVEGLAPHFQIELFKEGRMDAMRVHIEALPGFSDHEFRTHAAAEFSRRVKEHVGVSVDVALHDPAGVARSQGKAVRIIDNRGKS